MVSRSNGWSVGPSPALPPRFFRPSESLRSLPLLRSPHHDPRPNLTNAPARPPVPRSTHPPPVSPRAPWIPRRCPRCHGGRGCYLPRSIPPPPSPLLSPDPDRRGPPPVRHHARPPRVAEDVEAGVVGVGGAAGREVMDPLLRCCGKEEDAEPDPDRRGGGVRLRERGQQSGGGSLRMVFGSFAFAVRSPSSSAPPLHHWQRWFYLLRVLVNYFCFFVLNIWSLAEYVYESRSF